MMASVATVKLSVIEQARQDATRDEYCPGHVAPADYLAYDEEYDAECERITLRMEAHLRQAGVIR